MRLLLFNYRCAACAAVTKAPGLPDQAYGEFIMFNDTGDWVYLNAIKDVTFNEFCTLFESISLKYGQLSEEDASNILQAAYGIACDPSPDGSRYSIKRLPACEQCGSKNMSSWGVTNPIEFVEHVESPTHREWEALSEIEKKKKIELAVQKALSLGH